VSVLWYFAEIFFYYQQHSLFEMLKNSMLSLSLKIILKKHVYMCMRVCVCLHISICAVHMNVYVLCFQQSVVWCKMERK